MACIAVRAPAQQPAPSNAADIYREAMAWWVKNAQGDERTLSDDEVNALNDYVVGSLSDIQRSAYDKVKPYIDLVRRAASTKNSDFQLDHSQGFDMLLPHLAPMRNATRMLRFDANSRMAGGDAAGAFENLEAIIGIAQHARGDGILISSLVSGSIISLHDSLVDEALESGVIDSARADAMLKTLGGFQGDDPLRLAPALHEEAAMLNTTFDRLGNNPAGIHELLASMAWVSDSVSDETSAKLDGLTPDSIRDDAARFSSLMDRYAAAASNPDRDAARKAIAELKAGAARGDEGLLASLLAPEVERAVGTSWRVMDLIAARTKMLEEIRDGKRSPASFMNAAYAYLRLAALVDGMPEETQRDIEAARVAGNALDLDAVEVARRHIAPLRERMQREFRSASTCGRCDFAIRYGPRPTFMPAYLATLRGAARVALCDALVGASPKGPDGRDRGSDIAPVKPREAIAWILTLARHLASDPAIGHSLVAATLLADASTALDDATRRGLLGTSELASLRELLARFDAIDPIAMRLAVAKERELIEKIYGVMPDGSPRHEHLRRALARRDANAIAAYLFTGQFRNEIRGAGTPAIEPENSAWSKARLSAPLNGLGDLIDISAVGAQWQSSEDAPIGSGQYLFDPTGADLATWERMFATFTLKPCDVSGFEAKATIALATLNDLAKEKIAPTVQPAAPVKAQ